VKEEEDSEKKRSLHQKLRVGILVQVLVMKLTMIRATTNRELITTLQHKFSILLHQQYRRQLTLNYSQLIIQCTIICNKQVVTLPLAVVDY